jgi:multidrug efflux pump subunit AcrA (membrane-fusion protein)
MSANIRLLRGKFENQIVVPQNAILDSDQGHFVFLDSAGIARKVLIEIVATLKDSLAIKGLNVGDRLVVKGQNEISGGDTINDSQEN